MHNDSQIITIKGTKTGLTLFIDDRASFQAVVESLVEATYSDDTLHNHQISISVNLGSRYISEEDKQIIKSIIEKQSNLIVKTFHSDVILKEEANILFKEKETKVLYKVVRSGQVVEETGDLLLVGDVNPGGMIRATGNIYVMGNLLGIAHAGAEGNRNAIIVASYMNPSQLRIADYISRAPDYESSGVYMECGLIDQKENRIVLNRLQTLSHTDKDLNGFERRMENG